MKAGTAEAVLDLSDALPSGRTGLTVNREAEPVWAPDSKRVGFNYVVHEHRSNGFGTVVLFELRNDKWVFLRSPLDSAKVAAAPEPGPGDDNRDQLAKLAKNIYEKILIRPLFYGRRRLAIFSESSGGVTLILQSSGLSQAIQV